MKWLHSRTAVVTVVAAVAALAICLGTWQGWLAQASPAEVYVNDNLLPDVEGCNAPDGTTITEGITAADPGDTVIVCEGTYDGNVTVGKDNLTIEGRAEADRADIIVQGGSGVDGLTVSGEGVTVSHMLFDGVDTSGTGIHVTGDGATIQDVEATNWNVGIFLDASDGSTVEDSEVDDNANVGISAAGGGNNVISENVAGDGNFRGVIVEDEDLDVVNDNDLSGTDAALFLDADAPAILNVHVIRNTIHAGSDGIFIDLIDAADSLIVIGGCPDNQNTFTGSPDGATDFFIELTCGSEATVDATLNYWPGIATRQGIADLIWDDEDDNDCADVHGAVVFHPWATEAAPTPSPSPTPTPSPSPTASPSPTPGTRTFDLQQGWNNFVWTGATDTDPATVLSCIDGSYAIAYRLVSGGWERYVPGDPTLSTMTNLDQYDNLLVLVTAASAQCADMPVAP
jgi:parallel beta-helix repeat protein